MGGGGGGRILRIVLVGEVMKSYLAYIRQPLVDFNFPGHSHTLFARSEGSEIYIKSKYIFFHTLFARSEGSEIYM